MANFVFASTTWFCSHKLDFLFTNGYGCAMPRRGKVREIRTASRLILTNGNETQLKGDVFRRKH